MRVLMTTDSVGGVWTYSLNLARGLRARAWEVTLLVLGPPPSAAQRAHAADVCELLETGLPLDWAADGGRETAMAGETVAGIASLCKADIVHLNSPALAAEVAFDQPVIGVCHSCLASWWHAMRTGPMPAEFRRHKQILSRGYARCAALVSPSRSFSRVTAQIYGIAAPTVVHNGAPAPGHHHSLAEPWVILAAGRLWDEAKGFPVLAQAAQYVPSPI